MTEVGNSGQIPDWEVGVIMGYIWDILSWQSSLTSQTKIWMSRVWMRVLDWREIFYNNLKSRNNKHYHLLDIYSVAKLAVYCLT